MILCSSSSPTSNSHHVSTLLNMFSLVPLIHDLVHLKKMVHHRCSSNTAQNFYFYCIPRLWNSLLKIDLSLSTNIIKHKLYNYMWDHFMRQFSDTNVHTLIPLPLSLLPLFNSIAITNICSTVISNYLL